MRSDQRPSYASFGAPTRIGSGPPLAQPAHGQDERLGAGQSSTRVSANPCPIRLERVHRLQRLPRLNRLLSCGASLGSQKLTHVVDVSPVGNLGGSLLALTEPNVLFDQPSIRQSHAFDELLFPPAIEPVARTRFWFQARSEFSRFALEEMLGFRVVRVNRDRKVQAEPSIDVSRASRRVGSLDGASDRTGSEEALDSLLEFVFAQ